ncbi:hypothetical protein B0H13DRAFT_1875287 [Mycena leptocephala]|nr:hypothetical protein B0H13DRAFT_1875287 [Mycena leptocephala]
MYSPWGISKRTQSTEKCTDRSGGCGGCGGAKIRNSVSSGLSDSEVPENSLRLSGLAEAAEVQRLRILRVANKFNQFFRDTNEAFKPAEVEVIEKVLCALEDAWLVEKAVAEATCWQKHEPEYPILVKLIGQSAERAAIHAAAGGAESFSSYSSLVECNVSHGLQTDVVLGLDWAAHVRESLIGSGYRLESLSMPPPPFSAPGNPAPELIFNTSGGNGKNLFKSSPPLNLFAACSITWRIYPRALYQLLLKLTVSDSENPQLVNNFESQFEPFIAQPCTEDPATLLQIHIVREIAPVLQLRPLRRLLDLHDVIYLESDTVKLLRRHLNKFLERLIRGKYGEDELSLTGFTRKSRAREHARLRKEWPQVVPPHLKRKLLADFKFQISSENLATFVCGSCMENCREDQKVSASFEDFDINLLNRPDEFVDIRAEENMSVDSEADENTAADPNPWLDSQCPEPPMPMPDNSPYNELLIDPSSLETDPQSLEPTLALCRKCRSDLKAGRVPALSMANRNYLGPVPAELQNLTVVEEAMIALCEP